MTSANSGSRKKGREAGSKRKGRGEREGREGKEEGKKRERKDSKRHSKAERLNRRPALAVECGGESCAQAAQGRRRRAVRGRRGTQEMEKQMGSTRETSHTFSMLLTKGSL